MKDPFKKARCKARMARLSVTKGTARMVIKKETKKEIDKNV